MTTEAQPKKRFSVVSGVVCGFGLVLLALAATAANGPVQVPANALIDPQTVIGNMQTAYDSTRDYQARLVITGFGNDPAFRSPHKLRYVFKKPNRIRIDFEHPHPGMTIVYPDTRGKVVVRPVRGLSSFLFHFKPESRFVEISPGQQINQTDLGILIANIGRSLNNLFLGDLQLEEDREHLIIRVLSDNPFARGTPTRYTFTIDKALWLPVAVEESTAARVLKRKVVYEDLRINTGVADRYFDLG
ncbi:MAG: outer membrane lipoprotein carrier protein LolA [Syntrophobacteraceae bacterium]